MGKILRNEGSFFYNVSEKHVETIKNIKMLKYNVSGKYVEPINIVKILKRGCLKLFLSKIYDINKFFFYGDNK